MIEIKPKIENKFVCPQCKSRYPLITSILIQPVVVMADCKCENCGCEFLHTFPVGHTIHNPVILHKSTGKIDEACDTNWLTTLVASGFLAPRSEPVKIRKQVYKDCDQVVILNTLDYLYGHSLLKLYNAIHHLDNPEGAGLILILPATLEWMIPPGCAEAWIVDLKLSELRFWYKAIDIFIANELTRFTRVWLSRAFSHPNLGTTDIARFTKILPFQLSRFDQLPPTFTFILREDRWWFGNVLSYGVYRASRFLKLLKQGSRLLSFLQERLVIRTIRKIKAQLPNAHFHVIGMGRSGGLSEYAFDHRMPSVNPAIERDWCQIYSESHLVIGVHGSNMLLPTAHAAGCLEILPADRYGNMVQDLTVRYADRKQLFFYRFADQYSSPNSIAEKAVSVIVDSKAYLTNMCVNVYDPPSETTINSDRLTTVLINDDNGH